MHTQCEPAPRAASIDELEPVLRRLIDAHEELLAAVRSHRAAVSAADPTALSDALDRVAAAMQRVAEHEDRRRAVARSLVAGRAEAGPTLAELAALAEEPQRSRLLDLGARLRELVTGVRREQSVVGAASRSLLGHMQGLMRQVGAKLSHAGTYGRRGCVEPGTPVVSGIDLTR